MNKKLVEKFEDDGFIKNVQANFPRMFHITELENSKNKRVGMEAGIQREKIIIEMFKYECGRGNVMNVLPKSAGHEVDVMLFGEPLSIKTLTGKIKAGFKLKWISDEKVIKKFHEEYYPSCDILFAWIKWNTYKGIYYIPVEDQIKIFEEVGRDVYLKVPKTGTNSRGVEIRKHILLKLINNGMTPQIKIGWEKSKINDISHEEWYKDIVKNDPRNKKEETNQGVLD